MAGGGSPRWRYQLAARLLHQGAVIAYPTEGVWGLGCNPEDPQAVARLLQLKRRPVSRGLILVAASEEQFRPFLHGLSPPLLDRLRAGWQGHRTWLVPDRGMAPPWIRGDFDSVALRVSGWPPVQELCRAFGGPVVSTSANPQGRPPARTLFQARRYFGRQLDHYLAAPAGGATAPSEIRDLISDQVIRPA